MNYLRDDLNISSAKYSAILNIDESELVKLFEHKKVPKIGKKNIYALNESIAAIESHLDRPTIKKKIVSFFVNKGGTGKTLSTFNISHYLALFGYKVLLVDLDSQCNLTNICGVPQEDVDNGSPDIVSILTKNDKISDAIISVIHGIDIIKGSNLIGQVDIALSKQSLGDTILKRKFKEEGIREKYDFIFFDNHSAVSKASNNAFFVSDLIISVIVPDKFSADGVNPVINSIEEMAATFDTHIDYRILINNYEKGQPVQAAVVKSILKAYKGFVLNNFVKRSSDFARATIENKPFYCFSANNSNAVKDYSDLLSEFIDICSNEGTSFDLAQEEVVHGSI